MKLQELIQLVDGELVTEKNIDEVVVTGAMGADLMSDVLASVQSEAVLLTGLCNPQVVRTALIADIRVIVFVRGKMPAQETIDIANEENIPLVMTQNGLYESCGILYQAGLASSES